MCSRHERAMITNLPPCRRRPHRCLPSSCPPPPPPAPPPPPHPPPPSPMTLAPLSLSARAERKCVFFFIFFFFFSFSRFLDSPPLLRVVNWFLAPPPFLCFRRAQHLFLPHSGQLVSLILAQIQPLFAPCFTSFYSGGKPTHGRPNGV